MLQTPLSAVSAALDIVSEVIGTEKLERVWFDVVHVPAQFVETEIPLVPAVQLLV